MPLHDDPTDTPQAAGAARTVTPQRPRLSSTSRRDGFAALRSPNYRHFFVGQLPAVIGMWMQNLALSWLVLVTLDGSAFDLGLVNALSFGPVLLLGLYAGVVADRVNKRDLVNVTQAINLALAAAQAILIVIDRASLNQVFAFALVLGVANAFNQPARQAMTSELVERKDLLSAISLNSAVFNVGRVIGPSLAGVLIWQFGPAVCFAINAACYAFGLVMFRKIQLTFVPQPRAHDSIQKLREGLRFVRRTESVLLPTLLVGFVATFAMNFNVWIPLLATDSFGMGSSGLGLLMTALGAGSLLGALNLAFSGKRPTRRRLYVSAIILGVVEIVLAFVSWSAMPLVVVLPVLAASGFFMSTTTASANTIVQGSAPDELRGRVMSVYMTVFTGTIPIGSLLTGVLVEQYSAPVAIGLGGLVAGVAAVVILIWREGAFHYHSPSATPSPSVTPAPGARPAGGGLVTSVLPVDPRPRTPSPQRSSPAGQGVHDTPAYAPPAASED